jgi:hypothetical protein
VRLILTLSSSKQRERSGSTTLDLPASCWACCAETHSPREGRKDQRTRRGKGRQSCCESTCHRSRPVARRARHWLFAQIRVEQGNAEVVIGLIPTLPDTRYWHRDVAGSASVFFLKGRLRFGNAEQVAPFPSCLVIWGGSDEVIAAIQAALPGAWLSQ